VKKDWIRETTKEKFVLFSVFLCVLSQLIENEDQLLRNYPISQYIIPEKPVSSEKGNELK
jgi:hypothetical protein